MADAALSPLERLAMLRKSKAQPEAAGETSRAAGADKNADVEAAGAEDVTSPGTADESPAEDFLADDGPVVSAESEREEAAAEEEAVVTVLDDATPVESIDLDFSDLSTEAKADAPVVTPLPPPPANPEAAIEEVRELLAGIDDLPEAADGPAKEDGEEGEAPRYLAAGRGAVRAVKSGEDRLSALFDRVEGLLGGSEEAAEEYRPAAPDSLREAGLHEEDVERLALKFLNAKGAASGREVAGQLRLPYTLIEPLMAAWRNDQLVAHKNAAELGDYVYTLTDPGRERARRYMEECTYFGAAPVGLVGYLQAMEAQSIAKQTATEADLTNAFSDLLISPALLDKLGPAVNSGRGMFLFGEPGNGKTSVAERITACFGSSVWIPRALAVDGDIIRLYDPGVHEAVDWDDHAGLFDLSGVDQRWIQVVRPTVVAGGELTMSELEVVQNPQTKICEAPLQLKSNCGTLVIDDFGRQTMPVAELLNRWIVPLEKRYDFLNLPSGKKIQVPFDQLIIFSTNLEPKDLVDGAFLRRIPYKIEVPDPTAEHFRELFKIMAPSVGLTHDAASVEYLIEEHFEKEGRPFRACQPRDLLLQVRNFAVYKGLPKAMTPEAFDFAVENYFSVM